MAAAPVNSPARVLFASMIGTTIEFFDFYIYATAAVLVFPRLFFPSGDPTAATLQSLATFALAFFARPVGSAVFGHFGDRVGRKATLVAALLTMGLSTVAIGVLPTHAQVGVLAPALLALCRSTSGYRSYGEEEDAAAPASTELPHSYASLEAREFGAYLAGAAGFYGGDWRAARERFAGLRTARAEWVRETALYMAARSELGAANAAAMDEWGSFDADAADKAGADRAARAFAAYLEAYPAGRYAASAAG